jgi:hypothetical protein
VGLSLGDLAFFALSAAFSNLIPFFGWGCYVPGNPILDLPFDDEWVVGKTCAKEFDVPVQCVPKGEEYRSNLLVVPRCEKLCAQSANFIFHTTHGAAASG